MAIRFYDKGEHTSVFFGFRVASSLGDNNIREDKYFSIAEHGSKQAGQLAKAEDLRQKTIAASIKKEDRAYKKKVSGPDCIATGFNVDAVVGKDGNMKFSFLVNNGAGKLLRFKFTCDASYREAAQNALVSYCRHRGLDEDGSEIIRQHIPSREFIEHHLAHAAISKGLCVNQERYALAGASKGAAHNGMRYSAFCKALDTIRTDRLPLYIYHDKLVLFWRCRIDKSYYKDFIYEEWGGVQKALDVATSKLAEFHAVENAVYQQGRGVNIDEPSRYIKLYKGSYSNMVYLVSIPQCKSKSFSFNVSPHQTTADRQLHAYRTAASYAYRLLHDLNVNDYDGRWRSIRLYESGHPELPSNFGIDDDALARAKEVVWKEIVSLGLAHRFEKAS